MFILNVDDDSDDREMLCEALKVIGIKICIVEKENGLEALEFLVKAEILPDCIFMDVNMPKMNGFECVREIRSVSNLTNIPIIMYSTTFNPADILEMSKLGIKHLTKTFRLSELVDSIKNLLSITTQALEV